MAISQEKVISSIALLKGFSRESSGLGQEGCNISPVFLESISFNIKK
jgi:hypothetical protein